MRIVELGILYVLWFWIDVFKDVYSLFFFILFEIFRLYVLYNCIIFDLLNIFKKLLFFNNLFWRCK